MYCVGHAKKHRAIGQSNLITGRNAADAWTVQWYSPGCAIVCTSIEHMVYWDNPSPNTKQHLDLFSHFCITHGRAFPYFTIGRTSPLQLPVDKKAASPPHIDDSMVFVRLRQCVPHLIHGSLGRAHWRHLANTIKQSVCWGDAALGQITLTTCC